MPPRASTLQALNASVGRWIAEVAAPRPWPDDPGRCCREAFDKERPRLLTLPQHRLDTRQRTSVRSAKTLWVRFDRNDYSIPLGAVGKDLVLLATGENVRFSRVSRRWPATAAPTIKASEGPSIHRAWQPFSCPARAALYFPPYPFLRPANAPLFATPNHQS